MEHTTIAVDLAKSVFQVAVSHQPGRVDEERRLSRDRFLEFFAQRPPATVLLEACGSAHYWARQLQPFGHAVRLLAPHDVRPYVRRRKTGTDATRWSRRGLTTIIVSALFGVPAILVATVVVPVGDGGLA